MKILIFDTGFATEHAKRLERDGHQVRFFTFWAGEGFPKFKAYAPGLGLVEKPLYFFENINWADIIMIPDIGIGDLAEMLKKMGKPVWGAGKAEILEIHRAESLKIMDKLGIVYPFSKVCNGFKELRDYLETAKDKYVKFDVFRGDVETFWLSEMNEKARLKLDELELGFGPFADDQKFVVQDRLEGVEVGFDLIFDGSDFSRPYLYGYEAKGTGCYIGRYAQELPEPIRNVAEKIIPFLKENDYRGAISNEGIVGEDKIMKVIDWCTRFPYPLSAIYTEAIENYSEVIINVTNKKPTDLKVRYPYVASMAMESQKAVTSWLGMTFKPEFRNKLKLRLGAQKDDIYWAVPGFSSVLVVIGMGNTVEEAIEDIKNTLANADIIAEELGKENVGGLDIIKNIIEEGKKYGIEF